MEVEKINDNHVKLYISMVDQALKYASMMWQIPTALIATNFLILEKFIYNPLVIIFMCACNSIIFFVFRRMSLIQKDILTSIKHSEDIFKEVGYKKFVPDFHQTKTQKKFKVPKVVFVSMIILNLCLFIYSIMLFFKANISVTL